MNPRLLTSTLVPSQTTEQHRLDYFSWIHFLRHHSSKPTPGSPRKPRPFSLPRARPAPQTCSGLQTGSGSLRVSSVTPGRAELLANKDILALGPAQVGPAAWPSDPHRTGDNQCPDLCWRSPGRGVSTDPSITHHGLELSHGEAQRQGWDTHSESKAWHMYCSCCLFLLPPPDMGYLGTEAS